MSFKSIAVLFLVLGSACAASLKGELIKSALNGNAMMAVTAGQTPAINVNDANSTKPVEHADMTPVDKPEGSKFLEATITSSVTGDNVGVADHLRNLVKLVDDSDDEGQRHQFGLSRRDVKPNVNRKDKSNGTTIATGNDDKLKPTLSLT